MKLAICWYDSAKDQEFRLDGSRDFILFDADTVKVAGAFDLIQSVVDNWENKGMTIDQGGDYDWYELTLVDETNYNALYATSILNELEALPIT